MRLTSGIPAPDFTAQTYDGKPFELKSQRGHAVWLAFFRFVTCPFCAIRIHELGQRAPALAQRGLKVLIVLQSSAEALRPSGDRYNGVFTTLCDPTEELYRLYRLEKSLLASLALSSLKQMPAAMQALKQLPATKETSPVSKTRMPADFLIDGNGIIQKAYYGATPTDSIAFADVEKFLISQPAPSSRAAI